MRNSAPISAPPRNEADSACSSFALRNVTLTGAHLLIHVDLVARRGVDGGIRFHHDATIAVDAFYRARPSSERSSDALRRMAPRRRRR